MLTIAISSDLADEHPAFIAAMGKRGHQVDLFNAAGAGRTAEGAVDATRDGDRQGHVERRDGRQGAR